MVLNQIQTGHLNMDDVNLWKHVLQIPSQNLGETQQSLPQFTLDTLHSKAWLEEFRRHLVAIHAEQTWSLQ